MSIDTLHDYAVKLRDIGMLQVAGDLDYLVAWIRSPEWTGGAHLEPHPAGKNTVDFNSNDCPIPYMPCYEMVQCCTNKPFAAAYLQSAKSAMQELLSIYTDDVEQTAINAYLDYSDKVIALLKGEQPTPPTPPAPTSLTAYFNVNNPGVNVSLFGSSSSITQYNRLYQEDGSGSTSEISFDPSYTYTILHVYKTDGAEVLPDGGHFELGDSNNYLRFLFFNGGSGWVAARVEYTKSSTEMTAYFNSGVKNNQKAVSSSWHSFGDQSETLYPLNSDKTIPFDSTKTYKIKTIFYKNNINPVQVNDSQVSIDDLNYAGTHLGYLRVHTHVNNPATGDVCGCTYTVE